MSNSPEKVIQFLVSPQNDFITRIEAEETPPNELHVGYEAANKLRGSGKGIDPFVETVSKFFDDTIPGTDKLFVILDEDWHPKHSDEFKTWGNHCIKGTDGARLPKELDEYRFHERCDSIRANSINISTDSRFEPTIGKYCGNSKPEKIRAGIIGVWTHLKVEYLLIALNTVFPKLDFSNIGICAPLCASPRKQDHDNAIAKFKSFQVNVFEDRDEYCRDWLGLDY